jgi:hypothetical protein
VTEVLGSLADHPWVQDTHCGIPARRVLHAHSHHLSPQFCRPKSMTHFFKDIAIAGGFLVLLANGAGPRSIDQHVGRSK